MLQWLKYTHFLLSSLLFLLILWPIQLYGAPQPPTVTPGGLLYFRSQSFFDGAFLNLSTEDFEESQVAAGGIASFPEPLDNTTDIPGVFAAGDIVEGLVIQTVEGVSPATALLVAGNGWRSNISTVVGPNYSTSTLDILLPGDDVYAVSMELLFANSAGTATITLYGPGGTTLETFVGQSIQTTATYFGFYSPDQPITRISVNAGTFYEMVDNIKFGGSASSPLAFYTNRTTFRNANSSLILENFEQSRVGDDIAAQIAQPLDSSTTNYFFLPGDIVSGLSIRTVTPSSSTPLVTAGSAFTPLINNSSKIIGTTNATDNLLLDFSNIKTYAVGMDLMFLSNDYATISAYGFYGDFLGVTWVLLNPSGETFFGVHSNKTIRFILVHNDTQLEFVDNIEFGSTPTGLTFYNTENSFKNVRNNLSKEDFSKGGPIADNSFIVCSEPIDSNSDEAGCFEPDDILPHISFQTAESVHAACPTCIALWGANTSGLGNTTPLLAVGSPDLLEIAFSENSIHFVGMRMYSFGVLSVYGPNDILLGTAFNNSGVNSLNFWGVRSHKPISRITIDSSPSIIDEIMFGGKFPWPSFMPAIINSSESPAP